MGDYSLSRADMPIGQRRLQLGISSAASMGEARMYDAIAAYLTESLGVETTFVPFDSYEQIIESVLRGEVDLAQLPPLSYVLAKRREPGLQPLARQLAYGTTTYSSYVIVSDQNPARTLAELEGQRLVFVDERSTSGFLFPYAALLDAGIDPVTDFESVPLAGDHFKAVEAVAAGRADLTATYSRVLGEAGRRAVADGGTPPAVRILKKVGRIPHDCMVLRAGFPASGRAKIRDAILALNVQSDEGKRILAGGMHLTGWLPADDAIYDEVRRVLERVEAHRSAQGGAR